MNASHSSAPVMDYHGIADGHTSSGHQPESQLLHLHSQLQWYDDYHMTGDINTLAGNAANAGWAALDHQIKIIESEFKELRDKGVKARNIHEVRDGIADVLFTTFGLAHRAGIDAIADYNVVVASNFSKFDLTVEDAELTRQKYEKIGVPTYFIGRPHEGKTVYVTLVEKTVIGTDGKDYLAGKWMKSHLWQEPVFEPLPTDHPLVAELETLDKVTAAVVEVITQHNPNADVAVTQKAAAAFMLPHRASDTLVSSTVEERSQWLDTYRQALVKNSNFNHFFVGAVAAAANKALFAHEDQTKFEGMLARIGRLGAMQLHRYLTHTLLPNLVKIDPALIPAFPIAEFQEIRNHLYESLNYTSFGELAPDLIKLSSELRTNPHYAEEWYRLIEESFEQAAKEILTPMQLDLQLQPSTLIGVASSILDVLFEAGAISQPPVQALRETATKSSLQHHQV